MKKGVGEQKMGLTDRHKGPSHKYHFSPSSLSCPFRPTRQIMAATPSLQLLRCQVPVPLVDHRPIHSVCQSDVRCPPNASSAQTLDRHGQIFAGVTFGGSGNFCPQSGAEKENLFLILTKKRELSCREGETGEGFLSFLSRSSSSSLWPSNPVGFSDGLALDCTASNSPRTRGSFLANGGRASSDWSQQILIPTARCRPTVCQE